MKRIVTFLLLIQTLVSCSEKQQGGLDIPLVGPIHEMVSVSGKVTDSSGTEVDGIVVYANACFYDDLGGYWEDTLASVETDAEGKYEMEFLRPLIIGHTFIVLDCEDPQQRFPKCRHYLQIEGKEATFDIKLNYRPL